MGFLFSGTHCSTPYEANLRENFACGKKKRRKAVISPKAICQNHSNCSLSTSTKGSLFRTLDNYSFTFNGGLCNHSTASCLLRTPNPGREQLL